MAYSHDAFAFSMDNQPQLQPPMYFHHQIQYGPYLQQQQQQQQQQQHSEMMYSHMSYPEYTEYMAMGMMPEEFEDGNEVSTRPRLTKEQVEVLEAQFQAHAKPNSMVKKQLAMQTKLTLPRVANWFQNRRAKAKQQRKQEEFEISQNMAANAEWKNEANAGLTEASSKTSSPARRPSTHEEGTDPRASKSPRTASEPSRLVEASLASLQRALDAGRAAQRNHLKLRGHDQSEAMLAMPPPELPRYNGSSASSQRTTQRAQTSSLSPTSEWSNAQSLNGFTSPPSIPMATPIQDLGFDFGFDQDVPPPSHSNLAEDSPGIMGQNYVVAPDDWSAIYSNQHSASSNHNDLVSGSRASPLSLPAYSGSRRGSGSEELAANLGTFDIAGTPPIAPTPLSQMSARSSDGEIDIASRRKRPRPAALTSASLRSRSYGQLSSTSPAFRTGPPNGNALRHVKSTGHSLNSHYAGIRKSSLPQKSPLNLASFAEAESLKRLMAQQAAASTKTPLTTPCRTDMGTSPASQGLVTQLGLVEDNTNVMLPSEVLARYQHLQSPPHTPFQSEYMMQSTATSMLPPSSARSQYASFAEYTPPYSAGPLTNSTCWSDAPLHSPDVTGFPSGQFMSPMGFAAQQDPSIQQWILPSEQALDLNHMYNGLAEDNKKTEFFITEFPGQKEEYASIAQHVPQPKPKNYVFANTAPSDYDG